MTKIPSQRRSAPLAAILLFFAIVLASASTARASLYTSDWLTPGDGLVLIDSAQNLEWLNLNLTKDISREEIEDALSHGGSITLSDGNVHNISGWSIASQSVADQLLLDAGITLDTWSEARAPIEGLLSKWGTLYSSSTDWHSRALTSSGYNEYLGYRNDGTGYAVHSNIPAYDYHDSESGVALQRPVPEPSTLALLSIAVSIMFLFIWQHNY